MVLTVCLSPFRQGADVVLSEDTHCEPVLFVLSLASGKEKEELKEQEVALSVRRHLLEVFEEICQSTGPFCVLSFFSCFR